MTQESEIIKLNLEGEICPYTLIRTIRKVEEIEKDLKSGGKILEVAYDHPPVSDNVSVEFQKRGFRVEIKKTGAAKWQIIIKK